MFAYIKGTVEDINENGIVIVSNDIGFDIVDNLDMDGVKVAYQGIAGAYQQQAAMEYFGENAEYINVP